jgi:hypothetical protein
VKARFLLLAAVLLAGCVAGEGEDAESSEDAVNGRKDSLDRPTDTRIDLAPGLWHDNVLTPTEGWHVYHFTPSETGYYAVQMKSPPGHANMWSYLRIEEEDPTKEKPWISNTAGVGNTRTNLCEMIMTLERGKKYDVFVTSQHNLAVTDPKKPHRSDGPYTIGVLPVPVRFP